MSFIFTLLIFIVLSEYIIDKDLTKGYKQKIYNLLPNNNSRSSILQSSMEMPLIKRKRKYDNMMNRNNSQHYEDHIKKMFEKPKKKKVIVSNDTKRKIDDFLKDL